MGRWEGKHGGVKEKTENDHISKKDYNETIKNSNYKSQDRGHLRGEGMVGVPGTPVLLNLGSSYNHVLMHFPYIS